MENCCIRYIYIFIMKVLIQHLHESVTRNDKYALNEAFRNTLDLDWVREWMWCGESKYVTNNKWALKRPASLLFPQLKRSSTRL